MRTLRLAISCFAFSLLASTALSGQEGRPFTVADDVGITQFGDIWTGGGHDLLVSPSGRIVAVHTTTPSLEDGRLHDQIRFYDLDSVKRSLEASSPGHDGELPPTWKIEVVAPASHDAGSAIDRMQWLADGSGIAFLRWTEEGTRQLCEALLAKKLVQPLTSSKQNVLSFAIRDETHFVFTVPSQALIERTEAERALPATVGTGQSVFQLLYPRWVTEQATRVDLWSVQNGAAHPVVGPQSSVPIFLYGDGLNSMALSPDGRKLVTIRPVSDVPPEWISRYLPPYPGSAYRLRAGQQDLMAPNGWDYAGEYVLIDLQNGDMRSLTQAPEALRAGWWENAASPMWSSDGTSILLPGTFAKNSSFPSDRPCFAIAKPATGTAVCIRPFKRNLEAGFEPGYEKVTSAVFTRPDGSEIKFVSRSTDGAEQTSLYSLRNDGIWISSESRQGDSSAPSVSLQVVTSYKSRPILVAVDRENGFSRTVYDPNPQLKNVNLVTPELFTWSDRQGHSWQGLLYKPVGFEPHHQYPLVIENHGFSLNRFAPSAGFPTAFVAQELAGTGIMVLHVRDCAGRSTPIEAECNVREYDEAIQTLADQDMVDTSRLGIIGFSRTVYYVLSALTTGRFHFRAASITDGINLGYANYLHDVDADPIYTKDQESIMGGPPIGNTLLSWIKLSPVFNLDRLTTPLRVVATEDAGILEMWEPYAVLRRQGKPVDLVVLHTHQHVLSDPRIRAYAQQGNLDWFRFWLQDSDHREDCDEAGRWRVLQQQERHTTR